MTKGRKLSKRKKIILISITALAGLAFIVGMTAYVVIHQYISKINYVPLEEADQYTEVSLYEEPEEAPYQEALGESSTKDGITEGQSEQNEKMDLKSQPTVVTTSGSTELPASGATDTSVEAFSMKPEETTKLEDDIRKNISDQATPIMKDSGVLNIMLIGTDNRSTEEQGLSDSMVLLSINEEAKKIIATSLLRDIYLKISGKEKFNRLNSAYSGGGAKLLLQTVEDNFKVKIDRYVTVDFYSFIEVIDAIGGIELEVTEQELIYINNYINEINTLQKEPSGKDYVIKSGLQLLNGKQALGYSRIRYIGTDFGRTERQRKVLEKIFGKVKKLSLSEQTDLLDIILPQVTTNFTEKEILSQLLSFPDYMKYDYESWCIPKKGTYEDLTIRGMQVLGIDFKENIKELKNRIYLTK